MKTTKPHRVKPGTLEPVFWQNTDFMLGKVVVRGTQVQNIDLPRGKLLCLPMGPVGLDEVSHWMCVCGTYMCARHPPGSFDK